MVKARWAAKQRPGLPDAREWSTTLALALTQSLLGQRSVAQLNRWVVDEVLVAIGMYQRRSLALHGRIALCGMISGYNDATPTPGPSNLFEMVSRRIRMEGFLVMDDAAQFGEARRELEGWLSAGQLKSYVDVQEGFEQIPKTFLRIFTGANVGKQTLKLAEPPLPVR